MTIFLIIYTITTTIIVLALTISTIVASRKTSHRKSTALKQQYIRLLIHRLNNHSAIHISAHGYHSRMALAEAIHAVVSHTYGIDTDQLKEVAKTNRLEQILTHSIALSSGHIRSHMLMLLGSIPISDKTHDKLHRHLASHNDLVRTSALLAILASKPNHAIRTIASLDFDLQHFDIARIIALLRRGLLPIAYEPLLNDSNRNLRMLGLAIVRSFGLTIAEKQLYNIIYTEKSQEIITEAFYTLASLGRPLGRTKIRERLAAMSAWQRQDFCRHMTVEGYSLQTVQSLFSPSESIHAERMINSYKRGLAKNVATV